MYLSTAKNKLKQFEDSFTGTAQNLCTAIKQNALWLGKAALKIAKL
jgi:hypothetical protein